MADLLKRVDELEERLNDLPEAAEYELVRKP